MLNFLFSIGYLLGNKSVALGTNQATCAKQTGNMC